jgi:hypothetical protein
VPTEQEIERARRAIMDAPKTETGLVLPPHIAQEREREQAAEQAPKPNRAQRRWAEKQARRRT